MILKDMLRLALLAIIWLTAALRRRVSGPGSSITTQVVNGRSIQPGTPGPVRRTGPSGARSRRHRAPRAPPGVKEQLSTFPFLGRNRLTACFQAEK
jgi:hypothetical protein